MRPGTLAYSSWLAMQASGEKDPDVCAYNDFALVRLDSADPGKVNPSVPGFGGAFGFGAPGRRIGAPGRPGSTVYSYGNSSLRAGVTELSPKQGVLLQTQDGGWNHGVLTLTPGVPGDSALGDVRLVPGTEPFRASLLDAVLGA